MGMLKLGSDGNFRQVLTKKAYREDGGAGYASRMDKADKSDVAIDQAVQKAEAEAPASWAMSHPGSTITFTSDSSGGDLNVTYVINAEGKPSQTGTFTWDLTSGDATMRLPEAGDYIDRVEADLSAANTNSPTLGSRSVLNFKKLSDWQSMSPDGIANAYEKHIGADTDEKAFDSASKEFNGVLNEYQASNGVTYKFIGSVEDEITINVEDPQGNALTNAQLGYKDTAHISAPYKDDEGNYVGDTYLIPYLTELEESIEAGIKDGDISGSTVPEAPVAPTVPVPPAPTATQPPLTNPSASYINFKSIVKEN